MAKPGSSYSQWRDAAAQAKAAREAALAARKKTKSGAPTAGTAAPTTDLKAAVEPLSLPTEPTAPTAPTLVTEPTAPTEPTLPTAPALPPGAPATPVTAPVVTSAIPATAPDVSGKFEAGNTVNALNREGVFDNSRLKASAEAYRNLPENATPEQKAAVRQEYSSMLAEKAASNPFRTASQAFGAPQRVVSPAEQARIAHYNEMFPKMARGENPYMIGTSTLAHPGVFGGGMDVTGAQEEIAARNAVNRKITTAKKLMKAERRYTAKDEIDKAADTRKQREQMEFEEGLKNPDNPKAGWDTDNAVKTEIAHARLSRDRSSLAGLAAVKKAQEQAKPQEPVRENQQELVDAIARQRIANEQWLAELDRRRSQMFGGNLAYNY